MLSTQKREIFSSMQTVQSEFTTVQEAPDQQNINILFNTLKNKNENYIKRINSFEKDEKLSKEKLKSQIFKNKMTHQNDRYVLTHNSQAKSNSQSSTPTLRNNPRPK